MPRTRITIGADEIGEPSGARSKSRGKDAPSTDQIGLFTGPDGKQRASEFTQPTPTVRDTPGGN